MNRYVNDSPIKFANATMKRYVNKKDVFLALYALKDLRVGTEIRFQYLIS